MHRYRFILYRPLQLLPVLFGISIITFVLVRSIPGDPARVLLGTKSTPEAIARIRAQFGLDEPLWVQYFYFIKNLLQGRDGNLHPLPHRCAAADRRADRTDPVPRLGSVLLAIAIAVPLAAFAARNRGGVADHAIRLISTAGLGFPAFWLGIMLIIVFSVKLDLFPVSGYGDTALDRLHHMVLPCFTVALALSAVLTRNLRASMLAEISSDHAMAARARGLPEGIVFWRHVLPNSLVPAINLLAVNIGWLIGGSVVVESVFSLARHGPAAGARHLHPRLHGGAGCRHGLCLRHRADQFPRRHLDRRHRSAGKDMTRSRHSNDRRGACACRRRLSLGLGDRRIARRLPRPARAVDRTLRSDRAGHGATRSSRRASPIPSAPTTSAAMSSRASSGAPASICRWASSASSSPSSSARSSARSRAISAAGWMRSSCASSMSSSPFRSSC